METRIDRQRRLKILVSLLYYHPHPTGLTIHVQRVAEELARRGHEVTVLTARYDSSLPRDEQMLNGVRVVRLRTLPLAISRGMLMPAWPWAALALALRHDVIWANLPMLETAALAIVSRLSGRAVVATHHGDLILPRTTLNRFIGAVMYRFYTLLARRAAQLVAYSEDYAAHSRWLAPYRDKVSVISPPVTMPLPDRKKAADLRSRWAPDGGPLIGFAGRFVEEKRPDLLLRALEVVAEAFPEVRVVFAGQHNIAYERTQEHHASLLERWRDRVLFLGVLQGMQAMADFYAACDVLALTSDSECFALVQVEAMLCGTPVVMTDTPGGRVPVKATGMGRLAPVGDWRAIGEALVAVLQEPARYRRPRGEIERAFCFRDTVDRYERLFRRHARN